MFAHFVLWVSSITICFDVYSEYMFNIMFLRLFQWMRQMWQSDACYASYGVDGSECSFLMYLSEVGTSRNKSFLAYLMEVGSLLNISFLM